MTVRANQRSPWVGSESVVVTCAVVNASVPEPEIDPNAPRVATHEGIVRHVASLITPAEYELYDLTTDKNIDFLTASSPDLNLGKYVGMRVVVTGQESIAPRWIRCDHLPSSRLRSACWARGPQALGATTPAAHAVAAR